MNTLSFLKISINKIILLLFFLQFMVNTQISTATEKKFEIFGAILYQNTPDLSKYGFKKIHLFYEDELLDKHTISNKINKEKIKNAAKLSLSEPNIPVCLDIESWEFDNLDKNKFLSNYIAVINYFKMYNKKSNVGYFGIFPRDSPHAEYSYKNNIRETVIMPVWHKSNNFTKSIGKKVDIYYPVFYTRYKDRDIWIKIVKEKVEKIKEINQNAKIYGFIWPQYYTDDPKYKFIEREVWREQLETLYKYCDGAVIWSHYLGPEGYPINFDYQMDWFQETIDFIKDYNITSSKL